MYSRKEKNNMRTPKEKETILKDMLNNNFSFEIACKKYKVSKSVLWKWMNDYKKDGIKGLNSDTGKSKGGNKGLGARKPKNREEELELKLLRKEIELMRLKKSYVVKGVGAKKEYVSISDVNMK